MNQSKQGLRFALALLGICFLVTLAAIFSGGLQAKKRKTQEQLPTRALDSAGASLFKVDPFWPKPLPNRWSMQQVTGLYVDDKTGHIWFLNRGAAADGDEVGGDGKPPRIDCCVRGPEAIELDQEGNVVHAWGGPGYLGVWPTALQTILVDREGNIWVGGTAPQDSILKFSRDIKLLWDFGHRPPKDSPPLKENNQQTDVLVGCRGAVLPRLDPPSGISVLPTKRLRGFAIEPYIPHNLAPQIGH